MLALIVPVSTPSAQQGYLHLNPVVQKLSEGKVVFGVSTADLSLQNARSLARDPNIDYVYLDMEHNPMRFDQMESFIAALADPVMTLRRGNLQAHPAVFARFVPYGREESLWVAKHALDIGLMGILGNNTETVGQAEAIIRTMRPIQRRDSKIPNPQGWRDGAGLAWLWSVGGEEEFQRADLWPLNPLGDIVYWPMIETRMGVQNADAIAQLPGVGGFYLGAQGTLTANFNAPNNQDPEVVKAFDQIMKVCVARKIACGGTITPAIVAERLKQGYRIFNFGGANGGLSAENEAARQATIKLGVKR